MNEEEVDSIELLRRNFSDIPYMEGDQLIFTIEIKDSIDTNDAKPIYTKSYRHLQIHQEEVLTQLSKMLQESIILHSNFRKSLTPPACKNGGYTMITEN